MVIRFHLQKYKHGEEIIRNTYVDNVIEINDDVNKLKQQYLETKQIFNEASMKLKEYYSNNNDILEQVNPVPQITRVKILGCNWNIKNDTMELIWPKWTHEKITKRTVLAFIGSIFDPLGLLTPCTVGLKLYLQDL